MYLVTTRSSAMVGRVDSSPSPDMVTESQETEAGWKKRTLRSGSLLMPLAATSTLAAAAGLTKS